MKLNDTTVIEQPEGGAITVLSARDGSRLRYGTWPVPANRRRGQVLLLHGRTEFIEKHFETISDLLDRGFSVFTLDWRGQGLSDASNGDPMKGHVHDYDNYLDDLDLFVRSIVEPDKSVPLIVLGHSMGAHLALRFVRLHPDVITGMVLCSPLIKLLGKRITGALTQTAAHFLAAIGLHTKYVPGRDAYWAAKQKFDGNPLTSDLKRYCLAANWIDRNPDLAVGPPTIGWLSAMFRSIAIIHKSKFEAAIEIPVLTVGAGRDIVVSTEAAREYSQKLPSGEFLLLADAQHEILHERDELRDAFWTKFDQFVGKVL
jgi:lysophospholipase